MERQSPHMYDTWCWIRSHEPSWHKKRHACGEHFAASIKKRNCSRQQQHLKTDLVVSSLGMKYTKHNESQSAALFILKCVTLHTVWYIRLQNRSPSPAQGQPSALAGRRTPGTGGCVVRLSCVHRLHRGTWPPYFSVGSKLSGIPCRSRPLPAGLLSDFNG